MNLKNDINLIPKDSILKTDALEKQLRRDLPDTFSELKTPIYI
jgi:hypothetical protein